MLQKKYRQDSGRNICVYPISKACLIWVQLWPLSLTEELKAKHSKIHFKDGQPKPFWGACGTSIFFHFLFFFIGIHFVQVGGILTYPDK